MSHHGISTPIPDSPGIRLYESALSLRETDYRTAIKRFDSAIEALEKELMAPSPGKRQGLLEKLYDCYQRVWAGAIITGDDSATYYGNRTVEIARELEYSRHKAIKTK